MIDILVSTGELFGALALIFGAVMVNKRTRRVAFAILRFGKTHMSPWMLAVFGACLAVPGPADECLILPLLVAITLANPRKRSIFKRYMFVAWSVQPS
jgi:hypothetical protein